MYPEATINITESSIVVPEGNAERALVEALVDYYDIDGIQVLPDGGITTFRDQLEGIQPIVAAGGVENIVIVADNDDDPASVLSDIQDQIRRAEGLDLVLPGSAWELEVGDPSVAIVTLPAAGDNGTVETLIWNALAWRHPEPSRESERFIARMPTGQPDKRLTMREKARFSAALAATCEADPSCMVHWMWQSNKGYTELLGHDTFAPLVAFLRSL